MIRIPPGIHGVPKVQESKGNAWGDHHSWQGTAYTSDASPDLFVEEIIANGK
jgi:hypothetical protein